MDYGHPLQLGVLLTPPAAPARALGHALEAERAGLDLVVVTEPSGPRLDAWTLLGFVAASTERIELAGLVSLALRDPPVLARAAASLDLLAGGRLSLGLTPDAPREEAGGWPPGPAEQADEAVEVLRELWGWERTPVVRSGRYSRLEGAQRGPAPAHNVPIWLTGASPQLLRVASRVSDGWVTRYGDAGGSGDTLRYDEAAGVPRLRVINRLLDESATTAGREPREIRRVLVVRPPDAARRGGPAPVDELAPAWAEELGRLVVEEGVGTILLDGPDRLAWFAGRVAPAVREVVRIGRATRAVPTGAVKPSWVRARRRAGVDYDAVPARLRDSVVEPGDAAYARVRSTYLRAGSPALVIRPGTVDEVVEALAFARSQPVPLSLRSAGHGISGRSTNDGGIVLDVGRLRAIEVLDEETRRVRVGPGARWGEVAEVLYPHGWALTSGDYGGVGVGGLAATGGIGLLGREQGLTIDRVRAVDMVLADGSVVHASPTEHPDLFWGARGAGFMLGVITGFELEAGVAGDVGFAILAFDAADTAGLLQRWGETVEASPRDTTSFLVAGAPQNGRTIVQLVTVVSSDDPDIVLARLQPFAGIAPLLGQSAQILPYPAVVGLPEPSQNGYGEPVTRAGFVEHITPTVAKATANLVHSGETYFFQIRSVGGAINDVDPDATAYAHRSVNFAFSAFGRSRRRLDERWDAMRSLFRGLYPSFETDPRPERVLDAYPPPTLTRLRDLKRRYDPDRVFSDNFDVLRPDLPLLSDAGADE